MKYAEALEAARAGHWAHRPHWHWVYLTSRRDKRTTANPALRPPIPILVEDDGTERPGRFTPLADDRKADDWEVVPRPEA